MGVGRYYIVCRIIIYDPATTGAQTSKDIVAGVDFFVDSRPDVTTFTSFFGVVVVMVLWAVLGPSHNQSKLMRCQ